MARGPTPKLSWACSGRSSTLAALVVATAKRCAPNESLSCLVRALQAVEFDVAAAYFDVLLAGASRQVQEQAVRRAEAILEDTKARRKGGVGLREDVLRAEVQVSESREELVLRGRESSTRWHG